MKSSTIFTKQCIELLQDEDFFFVISFPNTQSVVLQNFVHFENKKHNYKISDPVQIVELFALCLIVCFDCERNILWNRKLTSKNDDELNVIEN